MNINISAYLTFDFMSQLNSETPKTTDIKTPYHNHYSVDPSRALLFQPRSRCL